MARFESTNIAKVTTYNFDRMEQAVWSNYSRKYKKGNVPLMILLAPNGKELKRWTGFYKYEDLVKNVKAATGP